MSREVTTKTQKKTASFALTASNDTYINIIVADFLPSAKTELDVVKPSGRPG
jgi:hypothetical protein